MDTLPLLAKSKRGAVEKHDKTISQDESVMSSKMQYVGVEHNEDTYSFSSSCVSPLDPNLNTVQYLPTDDDSAVTHETDIIRYTEAAQHFSPPHLLGNSHKELDKAELTNTNLVMNTSDTTHYETNGRSLVNEEQNISQNHFDGYVQLSALNTLENNLSINLTNTTFSNISNPNLVDGTQQIPTHNETLEYMNIDADSDSHYMTQLSNGQIIAKSNVNGRYLHPVMNSLNNISNLSLNRMPESNVSGEFGPLNGALLGRITENLLPELQVSDDVSNGNGNMYKCLHNNQQFVNAKSFPKVSSLNKTFKKYVITQTPIVVENKRKYMKPSSQMANKKHTIRKLKNYETNSRLDKQMQGSIADNNSDNLTVSPIELYENSSSFDYGPQQCGDRLGENGITYVNRDLTPREDFLVVDGGLYTLNGFKTQGFLIEQSSGDFMVCQQLDGQLAIDQSFLDFKLNQMLNVNQDINLSLNYDDHIVLDQNEKISLKTEMSDDLEKNSILSTDVVFNSLNMPEEDMDQDVIDDIDMKMNIINDIGGVNIDSKLIADCKDMKMEMEAVQKSKKGSKCLNTSQINEVFAIMDKTVLSRARASLPATYLNINKINASDNEYGVFARRSIPERTQFGPLEGIKIISNVSNDTKQIQYCVKLNDSTIAIMDLSDENTSNWMRFVRPACSRSTQNLVVSEDGGKLYFTTIQQIDAKSELRVWYSEEYANIYGFDLLKSTEQIQDTENIAQNHKIKDDRKSKVGRSTASSKILSQDKNECNICFKKFPRRYSLRRHMLTHQLKDVDSGIKVCLNDKQLKQNQSNNIQESSNLITKSGIDSIKEGIGVLEIAQNKENKKYSDDIEKYDGQEKSIKCALCPKVFSLFKDKFEHHMAMHINNDNQSYNCSQCPKIFNSLPALTAHLKTHPWLKCPMCEMNFTVVGELREHVKVHCINGVFTCKHCNKNFTQYRLIRKHIRAFHSEKKFSCPHCNKMFPAQDKLKMHLLRHSDHREFLCAHCGKQFKRKDKLTEHMKCIHEKLNTLQIDKQERSVDENLAIFAGNNNKPKKFMPRVSPNDYHRFIYKCHSCLLGFKRRGMLVNHLAKRHPDVKPETVPELNLPILRTTRNYYCQYCCKVYKSSSKRKAHILKLHPGLSLPLSNRYRGSLPDIPGMPNLTYSQTVGSVTSHPHPCQWCHKQYASKAKLLQHHRKKHIDKTTQLSEPNDQIQNLFTDGTANDIVQKNSVLYSKTLLQEHESHIAGNQKANVHLHFETVDLDDPSCYTDEVTGVNVVNNYNYQNFQLIDEEQLEHVEETIIPIAMKLEKTPIVIDVSQLDEYRKSLRAKQQDEKARSLISNCVLADSLNRPPKKWSNNFSLISHPAH
ncbi:PR domain zinc finger protein 10-like isoform X2 [Ctenocephalides felis]|uniref:PR domain zinc finger protein 10-like isoform X2 n=1 Tax=Ctenocephalides felis TaxID=7515 RepID=UPI000E6E4311|nr:PR domain zinc finger protein 10-like isoform X2 [Ctenocephalides felis]